jgi:curved DNA-binding protein CbpA
MSPITSLIDRVRSSRLSLEQRCQLEQRALELYEGGSTSDQVEGEMREAGAGGEAGAISKETQARYEERLLRRAALPASARTPVNYYFALGVTPRASTEQIRRAYRAKARETHPDVHHLDVNRDAWAQLMTIMTDAEQVLTDPDLRRAYDIIWQRRSRRVGDSYRTEDERRGDWDTRFMWYLAEFNEDEEAIDSVLAELENRRQDDMRWAASCSALRAVAEAYEERIVNVRTEGYAMPHDFEQLAVEVRNQLHRKERLAQILLRIVASADSTGTEQRRPYLEQAASALQEVRWSQHRFDIWQVRRSLGEIPTRTRHQLAV